jgi:SAM-dependent methyltransferase
MTTVPDIDKPVLSIAQRLTPRTIVDIASGYGHNLWFYIHWAYGSLPDPILGVAVDLFLPYLKDVQKWNDYVVQASADHLPFRDKVFDLAIFTDGPEHLFKAQGNLAIMEMKRVGKHSVLATPRQFAFNPPAMGNEGNLHRSVWSASELCSYGLQVSKAGSEYVATTFRPIETKLRRKLIPLIVRRAYCVVKRKLVKR